MRRNGRVAVITGASSGIGRRTASEFARGGTRVCLVARRQDRLEDLLGELGGEAAGHSYVAADVSDRAQVAKIYDHVAAVHGRCDVLVNNAGFSRQRSFAADPEAIDSIEAVMGTNFFGAVYTSGALLPLLTQAAPGHIVNVASIAGRLALGGSSTYCASKFALVGWSEALHHELKGHGVHVGLIEPGPLPTEGFPQKAMVGHPVYRFALTSEGDVARAIVKMSTSDRVQRVIPRWFYLLQLVRVATPFAYRKLQGRSPR